MSDDLATDQIPQHPPGRIRERLLAWYEAERRDLPWRRTRDPYRIWVAEVLLTQTRVETVSPYYERFIERFPTADALAEARLDDVLKAWEGLGYYARARNLHRAARIVVDEHAGALPRDPGTLRDLPGIGPYTEAAIRSIAFGEPVAAVDGNVRRVISRLHDLPEPTRAEVRRRADPLVRGDRPGEINQALMDLGATVCRPRDPRCDHCPLDGLCLARARGTQEERPARRPSKRRPHYEIGVGVICRDDQVLISKRPPEGLLGGLWEFPGGKREPDESLEAAVVREVREELGISVVPEERIATVDHAYSHFEITLHAFRCRYSGGEPEGRDGQEFRWVRRDELESYAFPAANRRVIERLTAES